MKKELQDALRKQPTKTKPRGRIARKIEPATDAKATKAVKPAAKGKEK